MLALALSASAAASFAQEAERPTGPVSPILTLDQDRLFAGTLWGKRVNDEIEAASAALTAENREIETQLTAEERALTDKRPDMPVEEFRAAADAFDAKVTEIRRAQEIKARSIGELHDSERQKFYAAAFPVMGEVLRAKGAVAVLDSRAIFLAADVIDVTNELIARIDTRLGNGKDVADPAPEKAGAPAAGDGN